MNRERTPSPPGDPKLANMRRRSSMGHSIRKSKSIVGLPFEDQVGAIAKNSSAIEDRLLKIVSASWSAASRLVQQEYDNQETSMDNAQADLADHITKSMGSTNLILNATLMSVKESVSKMAAEAAKSEEKPQQIVPPRLKKLHAAVEVASAEINQWKELHHERKNMYSLARIEAKQVASGAKCVDNSVKEQLPKPEAAWLCGLSDGRAEWEQIQNQEKHLIFAKKQLLLNMNRKRTAIKDAMAEISLVATKIHRHSEKCNMEVADVVPPQEADFTLN